MHGRIVLNLVRRRRRTFSTSKFSLLQLLLLCATAVRTRSPPVAPTRGRRVAGQLNRISDGTTAMARWHSTGAVFRTRQHIHQKLRNFDFYVSK